MKTTFTVGALLLFGAGAWAQSGADEAAIKERVMQSTKDAYSLRQAEYEAGMTDKTRMIQVSNHRSGYQVYQPGTTLASVFGSKPREINPRPDNFTFRFYGPNAAFVTYDQNLYDKPSKEIRMMEKQNGQWKTAASMSYWD